MATYKDLVISSPDYSEKNPFRVAYGDTAENMNITDGGVIDVLNGGKIVSANVSNGGTYDPGSAGSTLGRLIVENGGTANVVDVDNGLEMEEYEFTSSGVTDSTTYVDYIMKTGEYLSGVVGLEAAGLVTSLTVQDGLARAVSGAVLSKVNLIPRTSVTTTGKVQMAEAGLIVGNGATATEVFGSSYAKIKVTEGGSITFRSLTEEDTENDIYTNVGDYGAVLYVEQGGSAENVVLSIEDSASQQNAYVTLGSGTLFSGVINDVDAGEETAFTYKNALSNVEISSSPIHFTIGKGGTASNTTIKSTTLNVENTGKATGTIVGSASAEGGGVNGYLVLDNGGIANTTQIRVGLVSVNAGGTASGVTLGNYTIVDATEENMYFGTSLSVAGGSASNVSNMTVGTKARYDGTIGSVSVSSGGTVKTLKMNGYSRLKMTGGTVSSVTVTGGYTEDEIGIFQAYYNDEFYSVVTAIGSTETSGPVIDGLSLKADKGKYLYASFGNETTANNVSVGNNGTVITEGTVVLNSTTVSSAGTVKLNAGAESYLDKINAGGQMIVSSGAVTNSTTVASGGLLKIVSGGNAEVATVQKGGSMTVEEGAKVSGTTILSGGHMFVTIAKDTSWSGTYNKVAFDYKTTLRDSSTETLYYDAVGVAASGYVDATVAGENVTLYNAMTGKGGMLQTTTKAAIENVGVSAGGKLSVGAGTSVSGARVYKNGIVNYDAARDVTSSYDSTTSGYVERVTTTRLTGSYNYAYINYGVNLNGETSDAYRTYSAGNESTFTNFTVSNKGYVVIKEKGTLNGVNIAAGGSVYAAANSTVTGQTVVNGTLTMNGCTFCFNLADYSPSQGAYITNFNKIVASSVNYEVKLATNQADGKYVLATNANDFNGKITLKYVTECGLEDDEILNMSLSVGETKTDASGLYTYSLVKDTSAKTLSLIVSRNKDVTASNIKLVNPNVEQYYEFCGAWKTGVGYGYGSVVYYQDAYYQNQSDTKKVLTDVIPSKSTDWTKLCYYVSGEEVAGIALGTKLVYNGIYYVATKNTDTFPGTDESAWDEKTPKDDYLIVSNESTATEDTLLSVGDKVYVSWNMTNFGTMDSEAPTVQLTVTNRLTGETYTAYTLDQKHGERLGQDDDLNWYMVYEDGLAAGDTFSSTITETKNPNPVYKVGTLEYVDEYLEDTPLTLTAGGYYDITLIVDNGDVYTKSVYVVDKDAVQYFNSDYDVREDLQGSGYERSDKSERVTGYAGNNEKMTILLGDLDAGIYSFEDITFDSTFTGTVTILGEDLKKVTTMNVKNGVVTISGAVLSDGNYALQIQGKNASSYEIIFAEAQDLSTDAENYGTWIEAKTKTTNAGALIGTKAWVSGTLYASGDIVFYEGAIWKCGQLGTKAWVSGTLYASGDIVFYEGAIWKCGQQPSYEKPSVASGWILVAEDSVDYATTEKPSVASGWILVAEDSVDYATTVLSTDLTVGNTIAYVKLDVFNEQTYNPAYLYTFSLEDVGGDDKLKVSLISVTTNAKGVSTSKVLKSATFTGNGELTTTSFTDTDAEYYICVESLNASQGVKSNVTVKSYMDTATVYSVNKIYGVGGTAIIPNYASEATTAYTTTTFTGIVNADNDDDVMSTAQAYNVGALNGYVSNAGKSTQKFIETALFDENKQTSEGAYDYEEGDTVIYDGVAYTAAQSYPTEKPSTTSHQWTQIKDVEVTTADAITYGITDWIGQTDTTDWYKFTVSTAGTYSIGAIGDDANVKVTVYSAYYDGKDYSGSTSGEASAVKSLATNTKSTLLSKDLLAGEYYVKVETTNAKSSAQNTKYALSFALAAEYTEIFTENSEENLYTERNTSYTFTLNGYYDVTFYSVTGVTLYQNDGKNGMSKITVKAGTAVTLAAGQYYIDITSKAGSVTVGKKMSSYSHGAFSDNNTWLKASDITDTATSAPDTKYTGWVGYGNLASYYKISVGEKNSGSYTISLNTDSSRYLYTAGNLKMTLYRETTDKNGIVSLTAVKTITAGKGSTISVSNLLDGDYYIELASTSASSATAANAKTSYYSFSVTSETYKTLTSYDAHKSEKPTSGTVLASGEYAAFTLTEKSYITLNDTSYLLYENNGSSNFASVSLSSGSAVLDAGTYYVKATSDQTAGSVGIKTVSGYEDFTPETPEKYFGTIVDRVVQLEDLKDWVGLDDGTYEYTFTSDVWDGGTQKSFGATTLNIELTDAIFASKTSLTFSVSMLNSSGKWVTVDSASVNASTASSVALDFDMYFGGTYKISVATSDKGKGTANAAFTISGTTDQSVINGTNNVDMDSPTYEGITSGEMGLLSVVTIDGFTTYVGFNADFSTKNYTLYRMTATGLETVAINNAATTWRDTQGQEYQYRVVALTEGVYYVKANADLIGFNVLQQQIVNSDLSPITFTKSKAVNNVSQMTEVSNWVGATNVEDAYLFNTMGGLEGSGCVEFGISSMTNTTDTTTDLNLTLYKNVNGTWKQVATSKFSSTGNTSEDNPVSGSNLVANLEDNTSYKLVVQAADKGANGDNATYKISGSIDWFDLDNNSLLSPTLLKYEKSAQTATENLYQWDAVVAKTGDLCDCYDVNQLSNVTLDLSSGSVKVTFYDENFDSVKFHVDGGSKTLTSYTLTAGKETTMAISDILSAQDDIRYMKVEAAGSTNSHYAITSIKPS